ncbi:tRNA (adenine22-N1)-methyltransferase [Anaerotaenia torta]|uniref:tRNA (adenine(22)-N(1))-methyltransferase n=1 Tax=Anaerotaenia torta TaxID=433293 RepID=UPI003D1AC2DA
MRRRLPVFLCGDLKSVWKSAVKNVKIKYADTEKFIEMETIMQLSKRLHAVASLVTPGYRVADIGCDHAYTSIYLAEHGIAEHIIAMDVNRGPIERAGENIVKYGLSDKIETRRSNGLEKLRPGEADILLIAGMGGALTKQILEEGPECFHQAREVILQPQSEINKVREMLAEHRFLIIKENMLTEDGKYYMMMKAVPEELSDAPELYFLTKREHFYYGRLLLEEKHPVLYSYLNWERELCENILQLLYKEETENALIRSREMEEKLELIQSGLEYFRE